MAVNFGVSKDATPQLYDFLLQDFKPVLEKTGEFRMAVVLERLEPLNLVYSNLSVAPKVLDSIFRQFCKSHGLKSYSSAYDKKQKTSAHGTVNSKNVSAVLEDYNLLFDVFFCNIQFSSKRLLIDIMDPFSNMMIVQGSSAVLKKFQTSLKKTLPKTTFKRI
ncbi:MAG: hypothetical protein V1777_04260 [Candidatus Micrarchaeota archaeon]